MVTRILDTVHEISQTFSKTQRIKYYLNFIISNRTYILFLPIPILYALIWPHFGFEDTDTGFIIGLAHRIINGELPYQDFIYVRPPTSIYFAAFFMKILPDENQILYLRILYYLLFAFQILFAVLALEKWYQIKNDSKLYLLITAYVLSVHNFPPMPWHTLDGVFFCALTMFILSRINREENFLYQVAKIFLCSISVSLAVMAKQSFLFFPIIIGIFLLLQYSKKIATIYIFSQMLLWTIILLEGKNYELVDKFIFLNNKVSSGFSDALDAGFITYFKNIFNSVPSIAYACCIIASLFFSKFMIKNKKMELFLFSSLIFVPAYGAFYFFVKKQIPNIFLVRFDFIGCWLSIVYILKKIYPWRLKENKYQAFLNCLPLIVMLSVSWMSSLSWGYLTPLLFFTPIVFIFFKFLEENNFSFKKTHLIMLGLLLLYVCLLNLKPYRSSDISHLKYNMGDISKKSNSIFTDKFTYNNYKQIKDLFLKYNGNETIVLSNMPLAHYLFDYKNPMNIDWAMDVELGFQIESEIQYMDKHVKYIVVRKKDPYYHSNHPKFQSSITIYATKNYSLVGSFEFFDVYQNMKFKFDSLKYN